MPQDKPRWLYRFDNLDRAFLQLQESINELNKRPLSNLEKEGIIQRFEYTWELAWKTMRDYLENNGVQFDTITPASVFRAAFASKLIDNGEGWMDTIEARNLMSHTYDAKAFEKTVETIRAQFFPLFEKLYATLHAKAHA